MQSLRKQKESALNAGENPSDHFADVSKMVNLAKDAQRELEFKRTTLTDKLFEISGFYLDTEIVTFKKLKSTAKMTRG